MKSLKTLKFGNVCFVRPDLQFESSYSYCSKHILIQLKKKKIIATFSLLLLSLF